jgi:hypothetical protein
MWTGFIWLKIRTSDVGFYELGNESLGSVKLWEYFD